MHTEPAASSPTSSYNAENYWVDVRFAPSAPIAPAVASTTPANLAPGGDHDAPTATFNQSVTAGSVTFTLKKADNTAVAGSTS